LATFPIFTASDKDQESVIKLVDGIQESNQHLAGVSEGSSRYIEITKHLDALNTSLDKLIYEIAGLTNGEVQIVENLI